MNALGMSQISPFHNPCGAVWRFWPLLEAPCNTEIRSRPCIFLSAAVRIKFCPSRQRGVDEHGFRTTGNRNHVWAKRTRTPEWSWWARFALPNLRPRPQQSAYHLPGRRHRHIINEGDLTGVFVGRQPLLDEVLDFRCERIGRPHATLEHDEGLDDFGA